MVHIPVLSFIFVFIQIFLARFAQRCLVAVNPSYYTFPSIPADMSIVFL